MPPCAGQRLLRVGRALRRRRGVGDVDPGVRVGRAGAWAVLARGGVLALSASHRHPGRCPSGGPVAQLGVEELSRCWATQSTPTSTPVRASRRSGRTCRRSSRRPWRRPCRGLLDAVAVVVGVVAGLHGGLVQGGVGLVGERLDFLSSSSSRALASRSRRAARSWSVAVIGVPSVLVGAARCGAPPLLNPRDGRRVPARGTVTRVTLPLAPLAASRRVSGLAAPVPGAAMLDPTDLPNADGAPAPTAWQARREWRVGLELASSALRTRDLHAWPQGDGHPVIVLPGFLAGPESTVFLRSHLRRLGYRAHDWRQGRNLGASPQLADRLEDLLLEIHDRYERRVSLVGWSAGGIYAREMARALPGHTRSVITLGSPFRGHPASTRAWTMYRLMNRRHLAGCSPRRPSPSAPRRSACPRPASTRAPTASSRGSAACRSRPRRPRTSRCTPPTSATGTTRDAARHRRPARTARGAVDAVRPVGAAVATPPVSSSRCATHGRAV